LRPSWLSGFISASSAFIRVQVFLLKNSTAYLLVSFIHTTFQRSSASYPERSWRIFSLPGPPPVKRGIIFAYPEYRWR
jgi:hypothetical protein